MSNDQDQDEDQPRSSIVSLSRGRLYLSLLRLYLHYHENRWDILVSCMLRGHIQISVDRLMGWGRLCLFVCVCVCVEGTQVSVRVMLTNWKTNKNSIWYAPSTPCSSIFFLINVNFSWALIFDADALTSSIVEISSVSIIWVVLLKRFVDRNDDLAPIILLSPPPRVW